MSTRLKLERLSEEQEQSLEEEINKLSVKGRDLAINALFIAGGLALSYFLFQNLFSEKKSKKKKKGMSVKAVEDEETQISTSMATVSPFGNIAQNLAKEALLMLLVLAKDKLIEYLNERDAKSNEHSKKASH